MRRWILPVLLAVICAAPDVSAQGVLGDVLAGKLVSPAVGQWAWYDLVDSGTHKRYLMRQAIVGEEKVGRKTGHWLEVEVVPDIGYATVYKLLLTGPASDPKNLHRLLVRQGEAPVSEVPIDQSARPEAGGKSKREKRGNVDIETPAGVLKAEHVVVADGGTSIELWLNDGVRPMGVVQMKGPQGELTLRNYGEGGENAQSRLTMFDSPNATRRSTTRIETGLVDPPDAMRSRSDARAGLETDPVAEPTTPAGTPQPAPEKGN